MSTDFERLTALVKSTIMELRDCGGVDEEGASSVVKECDSELWDRFGAKRVEALAKEILESEDHETSLRFTKLFDGYNDQYFGGQLPK